MGSNYGSIQVLSNLLNLLNFDKHTDLNIYRSQTNSINERELIDSIFILSNKSDCINNRNDKNTKTEKEVSYAQDFNPTTLKCHLLPINFPS